MKNTFQNISLLFLLLFLPVSSIYAAGNNAAADIKKEFDHSSVVIQEATEQKPKSTDALQLALIDNNHNYVKITAALFAFTLIIITFLMNNVQHKPKDVVTIVGLVSVIFGTILLVLVVDTTETLTAPMGILGAIAGYLFGTAQKKEGE